MAIFKTHKNKDFTVMSNIHLRDKSLSLKSKGLLSIMLSLPDDWGYSVLGLAGLSKDGKDTVSSCLNELSNVGYVDVTTQRNDKGQFETIYDIYESCDRENRCGKSDTAKQPQYNTNINNENKEISIINNTKEKKKQKEFDLTFISPEYAPLMIEWLDYKRELGEMYKTIAGIKKAYNNLIKFSRGNIEVAQLLIDYAIAHEWKGIWELDLRKLKTWKELQGGDNSNLQDIFRLMDEDMKLRRGH